MIHRLPSALSCDGVADGDGVGGLGGAALTSWPQVGTTLLHDLPGFSAAPGTIGATQTCRSAASSKSVEK